MAAKKKTRLSKFDKILHAISLLHPCDFGYRWLKSAGSLDKAKEALLKPRNTRQFSGWLLGEVCDYTWSGSGGDEGYVHRAIRQKQRNILATYWNTATGDFIGPDELHIFNIPYNTALYSRSVLVSRCVYVARGILEESRPDPVSEIIQNIPLSAILAVVPDLVKLLEKDLMNIYKEHSV